MKEPWEFDEEFLGTAHPEPDLSYRTFYLKINNEMFPKSPKLPSLAEARATKKTFTWWRRILFKLGFSVKVYEAKIIDHE